LFPLLLLLSLNLSSHSLDHNDGTTNDNNCLLLVLLSKQVKWSFFLLHVYFYLVFLFFSLLDIMSCMCECHSLSLSFSLSLFVFLTWIITKWSAVDITTMECCFEENMRNDPVTLRINDDEYVLDSYLSPMDFSHLYLRIEKV